MTPERFGHLADAYGADLRRWPVAEQAAAQALLASGAGPVQDALRQARELDQWLDSHQLAPAPAGLARQIAASAPRPRPRSFWQRYASWLSPAGFVGVGLAGIGAGMLVVSLSLPLRSSPEALPSIFEQSDAEIILSTPAEEIEQ